MYVWRLGRELLVEGDCELKSAALPRCLVGAEYYCTPVHYILLKWCCRYPARGVTLELLQVPQKPLSGHGRHLLDLSSSSFFIFFFSRSPIIFLCPSSSSSSFSSSSAKFLSKCPARSSQTLSPVVLLVLLSYKTN